jgi:hypothetical protein
VARSVVGSGAGITVVGTRRFVAVLGRVVGLAVASRAARSWGLVRRALARLAAPGPVARSWESVRRSELAGLAAAGQVARSWGLARRALGRREEATVATAATGWAGGWSRSAGELGVAH